jgi:hypothetical protein
VVDDQNAVEGATNVQLDAINAEFDGRAKRRTRVLALAHVQSAMREDFDHL